MSDLLGYTLTPRESVPEELRHLVPKQRDYILKQDNLDALVYSTLHTTDNVLLEGEPGTGKSEFVLYLASLLNQPVVQIQGDGDLGVMDIIGNLLLKNQEFKWQDGPLAFAIRHGCWLLVDEINLVLPEVLGRFYSLLDDRRFLDLRENSEIIQMRDSTRIFATMNPNHTGRHIGTKPLPPALESRFHLYFTFNYLPAEEEIKLLLSKAAGLTPAYAKAMRKYAEKVRESFLQGEFSKTIDPRALINWARYTVALDNIEKAAQITVLNKFGNEENVKKATELMRSLGIIE